MRKLAILSTLFMLTLTIAGCGGGSAEPSKESNGIAPTPPDNIPKAPGKPTGKAVD